MTTKSLLTKFAIIALFALPFSSMAADPAVYEAVTEKMIKINHKIVDIIETVTDEASAKAASAKIEKISMEEKLPLALAMKPLGEPDAETKKALSNQMEEVMSRMMEVVTALAEKDPSLLTHVMGGLDKSEQALGVQEGKVSEEDVMRAYKYWTDQLFTVINKQIGIIESVTDEASAKAASASISKLTNIETISNVAFIEIAFNEGLDQPETKKAALKVKLEELDKRMTAAMKALAEKDPKFAKEIQAAVEKSRETAMSVVDGKETAE